MNSDVNVLIVYVLHILLISIFTTLVEERRVDQLITPIQAEKYFKIMTIGFVIGSLLIPLIYLL